MPQHHPVLKPCLVRKENDRENKSPACIALRNTVTIFQAGLRARERVLTRVNHLPALCAVAFQFTLTRLPLRGQRRDCHQLTHRLPVSSRERLFPGYLKLSVGDSNAGVGGCQEEPVYTKPVAEAASTG